jgi:cystathionine beta-lyase
LWRRDFAGGSSLFGVELDVRTPQALSAFIDTLELFGFGSSWGGYESLVLPARFTRTVAPFQSHGTLVRLHVGPDSGSGPRTQSHARGGRCASYVTLKAKVLT